MLVRGITGSRLTREPCKSSEHQAVLKSECRLACRDQDVTRVLSVHVSGMAMQVFTPGKDIAKAVMPGFARSRNVRVTIPMDRALETLDVSTL